MSGDNTLTEGHRTLNYISFLFKMYSSSKQYTAQVLCRVLGSIEMPERLSKLFADFHESCLGCQFVKTVGCAGILGKLRKYRDARKT